MRTDSKQHIVDNSDLRKWRTELPNLYDDMGLDPYEFRLLAHYKRVGNCTENVETTAEKIKMSTGKVSQVRASLWKKWKLISLGRNKFGGFTVKVKDIWEKNFAHYSAKRKGASRGEGVHAVKKGFTTRKRASPRGEGVHVVKQRSNNSKKQPIKNKPVKKQQQPTPAVDEIRLLDELGIKEPTRSELAQKHPGTDYLSKMVEHKKQNPDIGPGLYVIWIRRGDPPPRVKTPEKWFAGFEQYVNR